MDDNFMTGFLEGRQQGMNAAQAAQASAGMSPQQKVAMALQSHRGLFPQKQGMGGLSGLGNAALGAYAMNKMNPGKMNPGMFGG